MHKYLARFPTDLWQRLCEAARVEGRSVNAQLIWIVRRSLEGYRQ
jgi:hypothetical protein